MAIKITGTFVPSGDFGLIEDNNLIGSYQIVETLADRDAIPELKRKFGMLVYVKEDNKYYQLTDDGSGDLTNNNLWQEAQFGSNLTADNGLTITNDVIELGGQLTKDTVIDTNNSVLQIHHPSDTQPNADWSFGNALSQFRYTDPNDINNTVSAYISKDYFSLYVGSNSKFYLENPDDFYSQTRLENRGEIPFLGYVNSRAATIRVRLKADTNQPIGEQSGPYTIDGVETEEGDLIFLANQDDATQNGIYEYVNGVLERYKEFPEGIDLSYYIIIVAEGDNNKNSLWQIKKPAVLGTDNIVSEKIIDSTTGNYTFTNGLTENSGAVELGGQLTKDTTIDSGSYRLSISNPGTANGFNIDYDDKYITGSVQGSTLFDTSNFRLTDSTFQITTNIDNGDNTSTSYYTKWDKSTKEISSNYPLTKIKNDEYGITQIQIENANTSDNYTGASIVLTSSDTAYQDNTYISHLGSNFYVAQYQNSGTLFSDKTLWIGNPYDTSYSVNFVSGDAFDNPNTRMQITADSIIIKNENKLFYERSKTFSAQIDDITKFRTLIAENGLGEVLPFDINLPQRNTRIAYRTGANYVGASQTLDFGIYFRKDTKFVRIYKNDTLLAYGTDYEWSEFPSMPTSSPLEVDYTTKIKLLSAPDSTDAFRLEYDEFVLQDWFLDIRAIAWLDSLQEEVRPRMITKKININGEDYYLSDVTKNDAITFDCTYTSVNDPATTHSITKRFYNAVYFPVKLPNTTLNFEVELWRENKSCSFNNKINVYQRPPKQLGGHLMPVWRTDQNLIKFVNYGALKYRTNYFVRFRFTDANDNVYFSDFQSYRISKRYFNIFTTDSTFTTDTYQGVYETIAIVY